MAGSRKLDAAPPTRIMTRNRKLAAVTPAAEAVAVPETPVIAPALPIPPLAAHVTLPATIQTPSVEITGHILALANVLQKKKPGRPAGTTKEVLHARQLAEMNASSNEASHESTISGDMQVQELSDVEEQDKAAPDHNPDVASSMDLLKSKQIPNGDLMDLLI